MSAWVVVTYCEWEQRLFVHGPYRTEAWAVRQAERLSKHVSDDEVRVTVYPTESGVIDVTLYEDGDPDAMRLQEEADNAG